jgi:hypothetical protein
MVKLGAGREASRKVRIFLDASPFGHGSIARMVLIHGPMAELISLRRTKTNGLLCIEHVKKVIIPLISSFH